MDNSPKDAKTLGEALLKYGRRVIREHTDDPDAVLEASVRTDQQADWEFEATVILRYLLGEPEPQFLFLHANEFDVADEGGLPEGLIPNFVEMYLDPDSVRWIIGKLDPQ